MRNLPVFHKFSQLVDQQKNYLLSLKMIFELSLKKVCCMAVCLLHLMNLVMNRRKVSHKVACLFRWMHPVKNLKKVLHMVACLFHLMVTFQSLVKVLPNLLMRMIQVLYKDLLMNCPVQVLYRQRSLMVRLVKQKLLRLMLMLQN